MKTKNNSENLSDEELRRKATEFCEYNWKPSEIISSIGCSKTWI